jgi:hypothetical protein
MIQIVVFASVRGEAQLTFGGVGGVAKGAFGADPVRCLREVLLFVLYPYSDLDQ